MPALSASTAALAGVMRALHVREDKIQKVIEELDLSNQTLADGSFERFGVIGPSSFGGSELGQELSGHHQRAHHVVEHTIAGVVQDLADFRDSVEHAVQLISSTDEAVAGDLQRKATIADALTYVVHNSRGDQEHAAAVATQLADAEGGDD
ncbi:hypothetical protein [Nocardioides sp. SYSU D00038]|uniref:hypothetical protein n=1 Tax=Nocardioides sp. SYSU D00038 TaxID=2812554 RepID=UPI0019677F85|nr:hypothetical protein [Nocardioides sp. SYSU D00038]